MSEEDINAENSTEETETSASANEEQNNTSNGSETETTQKTGRTAQDRIRELVAENKRLKEQGSPADKPSSVTPELPEDKLRRIELNQDAPSHLKGKVDDMAEFWKQNPNLKPHQVYKLFDDTSVSQEDIDQRDAAVSEANTSRTGGTANPAARVETSDDVSKWTNEELDAEFERRLAQGEKF